jgi:hypothetical protein
MLRPIPPKSILHRFSLRSTMIRPLMFPANMASICPGNSSRPDVWHSADSPGRFHSAASFFHILAFLSRLLSALAMPMSRTPEDKRENTGRKIGASHHAAGRHRPVELQAAKYAVQDSPACGVHRPGVLRPQKGLVRFGVECVHVPAPGQRTRSFSQSARSAFPVRACTS